LQTFVVHAASGEIYKLRAVDAKERQEWITRLRVVAELHSQAFAQVIKYLKDISLNVKSKNNNPFFSFF
jgi:ribosomal protein L20